MNDERYQKQTQSNPICHQILPPFTHSAIRYTRNKSSFLSKYRPSAKANTPTFQYVTVLPDHQDKRIPDSADRMAVRRTKNTGLKPVVRVSVAIRLCGPLGGAFAGVLFCVRRRGSSSCCWD